MHVIVWKFIFFLSLQLSKASEVPHVQTKQGQVSGIKQKSFSGFDYLAYLGIPFAEEPTGVLRFQVW